MVADISAPRQMMAKSASYFSNEAGLVHFDGCIRVSRSMPADGPGGSSSMADGLIQSRPDFPAPDAEESGDNGLVHMGKSTRDGIWVEDAMGIAGTDSVDASAFCVSSTAGTMVRPTEEAMGRGPQSTLPMGSGPPSAKVSIGAHEYRGASNESTNACGWETNARVGG